MDIGSDNETLALMGTRLEEGELPSRVLLVPWGAVQSSSGDFVVDVESGRLATQAFQEQGIDLPIDYEHQTLGGPFTSPSGQAPAAGWIKRLAVEEGVGIFAEVAWTPPAAEQIAARQYRYLSPVALIRKSDRKLVALHSAALTNKPAIVRMAPIVNGAEMRNSVVRQAHQPVPELVEGPVPELVEGGDAVAELELLAAIDALRKRLALPAECADVEVVAAVGQRLADETQAAARRDAEERVSEAQRQGRLTPAQREWAVKLAMSDLALFEEWQKTAPVVAPLGRATPPSQSSSIEAGRERLAASARAEFRANPALAGITSEEAYVGASLREPLLKSSGTH